MKLTYGLLGTMILMVASPALASVTIPGADGSDGAFNPIGTTFTVDLSQAVTGSWDDPSSNPGKGVYDPDKWVVVFKYSSINVPTGTTVKFTNHPSRAPVVWLVNGSVTITGTVDLSGANGHSAGFVAQSEPGPGGFRGGTGHQLVLQESGGNGPGGTRIDIDSSQGASFGGSYSTQSTGGEDGAPGPIYGNDRIIPLIGGSGGAGYQLTLGDLNNIFGGGGAGGGAILIAASNSVTVNGSIKSSGGAGITFGSGGSGGAIRIVCDSLTGTTGTLRALGGTGYTSAGSNGRIRVESNSITLPDPGIPTYTFDVAGTTAVLWPEDTEPNIRITFVGTEAVPDDPEARLNFPNQDVSTSASGPTTIEIEATNMPLDWIVTVRAVPKAGEDIETTAVLDSGNEALSIWTAQITFPNGLSALQVRAAKP